VRSGPGPVVSEVRVEYGFDPARAIYLDRISVRDSRGPRRGGVLTVQTPLICDEAAARSLAAAILRNLCAMPRHPARLP
jgi:hypothetical protein